MPRSDVVYVFVSGMVGRTWLPYAKAGLIGGNYNLTYVGVPRWLVNSDMYRLELQLRKEGFSMPQILERLEIYHASQMDK